MTQLKFNTLDEQEMLNYHHNEIESYKQLRTNIEFSSLDKKIQVLTITSSDSAEAKTTTAVNLAKAMTATKDKVLLLDCDLRIPELHRMLKLNNRTGLTNAILSDSFDIMSLNKHFQMINVSEANNTLYVMTTGTKVPNPLEVLSSYRFIELITALKSYFDFIVIDAPPVLAVADSIPIGTASDGILFCVAANQTHKDRAVQAITTLQRSNIKIIGTVLTMVPSKSNTYYYYNYKYNRLSKGRKSLGHSLRHKKRKLHLKEKSNTL